MKIIRFITNLATILLALSLMIAPETWSDLYIRCIGVAVLFLGLKNINDSE